MTRWLLLVVVFLCSSAFADDIVLKDGRRFDHCWIESLTPENGGTFHVRIAGDKSLSEQAFPLAATMIQEITFSEIDEDGDLSESRYGDLISSTGQAYEDAEFLGATVGANGLMLSVYLPDRDEPIEAAAASLRGIEFSKTALQPAPYFDFDQEKFLWHVGTLTWPMTFDEEAALDTLSEEEREKIKGYEFHQILNAPAGTISLGGSEVSEAQFLGMVAGALFLILGIVIAISIVIGTVLIKLIAWFEGIKTATWMRCLLCSALLSTIPPVVGLLILIFVPCILKFLAIPVSLFLARNIVMGCLEVLEGQAWMILILLHVMQWALGWVVGAMV